MYGGKQEIWREAEIQFGPKSADGSGQCLWSDQSCGQRLNVRQVCLKILEVKCPIFSNRLSSNNTGFPLLPPEHA